LCGLGSLSRPYGSPFQPQKPTFSRFKHVRELTHFLTQAGMIFDDVLAAISELEPECESAVLNAQVA
jgi:hypothetical protein